MESNILYYPRFLNFGPTCTKISWTDRVKNEEFLHGVKVERNILHTTETGKSNRMGCILCGKWFLKHAIEGKIKGSTEVTRKRGRRRSNLM